MSTPRNVFRWINRSLPLAISITSLWFSSIALRHQTEESKMQLWHSLRQEFDHTLKSERRACGLAFEKGGLDSQYENMMNFFDTLGFLVRTRRLDDDVFAESWSYYFVGYFKACKPLMDKDRATDQESRIKVWQDVYDLAREYHDDPFLQTSQDLKDFFEDERDLPQ